MYDLILDTANVFYRMLEAQSNAGRVYKFYSIEIKSWANQIGSLKNLKISCFVTTAKYLQNRLVVNNK